MKTFICNTYKYLIKPLITLLLLILATILGTPIVLSIVILCFLGFYILLLLNKNFFKIKLHPIIKEAKEFYNINIIDDTFLTFYKKNKFTSIPMPGNILELNNSANMFKEKVGCIDCDDFLNNRRDFNIINKIKLEKKHIFFSPLYKDKQFLSEIHLYNLSLLDEEEIRSILSMNISDYQKAVIYSKFLNESYCRNVNIYN